MNIIYFFNIIYGKQPWWSLCCVFFFVNLQDWQIVKNAFKNTNHRFVFHSDGWLVIFFGGFLDWQNICLVITFRSWHFGSCLTYNEQWQLKRQKTCVSAFSRPNPNGADHSVYIYLFKLPLPPKMLSQIKAAGKLDFISFAIVGHRW